MFRRVGIEDPHIVERLTEVNFFVYDFEVSDGGTLREIVEHSLQQFISTATLLSYINRICNVTDVNKI